MRKILLLSCLMLIPATAFAQQQDYLGDKEMAYANEAAAEVVRERMATERPADAKLLKEVKSAEIIVVSGQYDKVQDVLNAVEIKHTILSPKQLEKVELVGQQLLIINCGARPSAKGIEKIRKFVKAGGFLYTTDWALAHVVEKAFPGYIRWNKVETANDVVSVKVKRKDNAFLQHVKLSKEDPQWWLEASSYPIEIQNKKKVEVLISSKEMKRKYEDSPIAVTFKYGDGRVLHIASHFYLQQNQLRSQADKKSGEEWLDEDADLSPATKKKLRSSKKAKKAKGGNIKSAYAAQQMTSNIVVERKKDQKRIKKLYNKRLTAKAEKKGAGYEKGKSVRILKKKGKKLKIRTDSGDEAWVDDAMVE